MKLLAKCFHFESEDKLAKADDTKILDDMGYEQELFRGVTGWFMNFAFTFTAVNIISCYSISFGNGIITGGPVVMVWGWVIGSTFTILIGASMAEICSTYPSAGSVYHWSGMLALEEWAPFFSYLCGWFNFLGNAAGDAAFASGFASIVTAAASYSGVTIDANPEVGISVAVLTGWCIINITRVDQQGWLNNIAAIFQLVSSFVIIIVVLSATSTRSNGSFVFSYWNNETGFDNIGYVCLIGLLTTHFAFSGYEAGGHMAEETQNARKSAPRGILACCVVGAMMGFIYILGLLFAVPDDTLTAIYSSDGGANVNCTEFDSATNTTVNPSNCTSNETLSASGGYNELQNLFNVSLGSGGGLAMTVLIAINVFFAGISSVTVTSRISFALARDGAFPGSEWFYDVNPYTMSPIKVVFLIWVFDTILLLLALANSTAFTAIVSLCTIGFQISYAIPIWLRVTHSRETFQQGAFNLGPFSIPCGWISATWLTFTSILFFFPFQYPVTTDSMNYTIVVVGSVFVIATTFWVASARHWFKGPKRGKATVGGATSSSTAEARKEEGGEELQDKGHREEESVSI